MAFSFNNAASFGAPAATPIAPGGPVQKGPDLEEVSTDAVGFQAVAGEAKVRLVPKAWPAEALPPPTASLLAVASRRGVLAAAGPDSVIISTTDLVRTSFEQSGGGAIKSFTPQLTLELGIRISQVAFSTDEQFLILAAERGGGLAVYEVDQLLQGNKKSSFELSTNNASIRAVAPNPSPEKAELIAVVTTEGELTMANLKTRSFFAGANGPSIKSGVSCVSWSNRGKQLMAGLGNGQCVQLTPEGEVKGQLPTVPGLADGQAFVSTVSWLENDLFLVCHTPSDTSGPAPTSLYHIVTRQKSPTPNIIFQQLPEVSPPFGLDRTPPHQFVHRLKDFPPNLSDVLLVASTASIDIGLVTRSRVPLSKDFEQDRITNVFTTTAMAEDSRRAQMPMTETMRDTSPIGVAFDLSAKSNVRRPLPQEEYESSPTPLPGVMILNNEGVLSMWWFVYAESIRQNTSYPGLTVNSSNSSINNPSTVPPGMPAPAGATSSSPFGKPAVSQLGTSSPMGASAAFGATSNLGQKMSPWAQTPNQASPSTFGKPVFGQSGLAPAAQSTMPGSGPAFGSPGGLGMRTSPWAAPSTINSATAFGQPSILGSQTQPFSSTNLQKPAEPIKSSAEGGGGFASFANQSTGFLSAAPKQESSSLFNSPAAKVQSQGPVDSTRSLFGSPAPQSQYINNPSPFANAGSGFQLGTTFKADASSQDQDTAKQSKSDEAVFDSTFTSALGAPASQNADADMGDEDKPSPISSQEKDVATSAKKSPPPLSPQAAPLLSQSAPSGDGVAATSQSLSNLLSGEYNSNDKSSDASKATAVAPVAEDPSKEDLIDAGTSAAQSQEPTAVIPESREQADEVPDEAAATSVAAVLAPDQQATALSPASPPSEQAEGSSEDEDEDSADQEDDFPPDLESDEEGSGIDVAEEISPSSSQLDRDLSPLSSELDHGAPKSLDHMFPSLNPSSPNPTHPHTDISSRTPPAHEVSNIVIKSETPRSPSPGQSTLFEHPLHRSYRESPLSGPARQSRNIGGVEDDPRRIRVPAPTQSTPGPSLDHARQQALAERQRQAVQEQQELEADEGDAVLEALLASEVQGSRRLDGFLAHQDYVGKIDKPGIPGQIEKIFRDINSMLDTLGLNARSLASFVKGQSEKDQASQSMNRDDLDLIDEWRFVDLLSLDKIENEMMEELDEKCITDASAMTEEMKRLSQSMIKLHAQAQDLGHTIEQRKRPEHLAQMQQHPLSLDQKSQLRSLRMAFTQFQLNLSEVEKKLSEMKAKVVFVESQRSNHRASERSTQTTSQQPTVQAIEKTITKMTAMARHKNTSIDELEAQLQNLGIASPGSRRGSIIRASRENSPFSPSPTHLRANHTNRRSSLLLANSRSSPLRLNASIVKGEIEDLDPDTANDESAELYRKDTRRRQGVINAVQNVFGNEKMGVRIRPLA